jgi:hypothetical protein
VAEPDLAREFGPRPGVRTTGVVLGRAAVVLLRHWPVLLALSLAGLAARGLLTMAAVRVSNINAVLGFLVLVLVPISMLTALVLMLRAIRGSLPWPAAAAGSAPAGPRGLLNHLGSVLLPFLAVYASYGYLKDDASRYVYEVYNAEVLHNAKAVTNPDQVDTMRRLPFTVTALLLVVVGAAVLGRWALSHWKLPQRRPWLGIVAAYLEIIWIMMVVAIVLGQVKSWLAGRRAVQWVQDAVTGGTGHLGPLSHPARGGLSWLTGLVGDAGTVIVVPVAWLTVGAVVYGYTIAPPPASANELMVRAARRWFRLPRPLRRLIADASASLRDRFGPMVHGVRLLARAGLAPMLLYCLAFLLVQSSATWLWEVERVLIGPRDLGSVWMPLSGPLSLVNDAIRTALLVCLLGAAVDQVLRAQRGGVPVPGPGPAPGAAPGAGVTAGPAGQTAVAASAR